MKKTKLFFVGAAILIGGGTAVHAQSWRNDGAVSLDKQYADYPCVNLLDSTSVTVEPTGQGSFAVCRAVRVQTTAGALQQRILKYDYDPLTAAATFKRVTIYHADGTYTSVDVSKACDYAAPARAIYWGARQIMLELGALQPGDIIDYEIDKKGFTYALLSDAPQSGDDSRFIPPMRGQFYDIVPFWSADPTLRKVYRVSLPAEKEMQFQFYQGSCASSMRYEDGRKVYTFAKDAILPFRREPNMVDFYDAAPKLMMSTTADWKEKSRWFYGVNEDYGSFTAIPEAQKKVDELIRGKKKRTGKSGGTHPLGGRQHPLCRYLHGKGRRIHPAQPEDELYRPLRGVQGHCRHTDCVPADGRIRSLSGHDHGRQPGGDHSGRPFQPLRGRSETQ